MLPSNLLHPLKLDVVGFKEEDHDPSHGLSIDRKTAVQQAPADAKRPVERTGSGFCSLCVIYRGKDYARVILDLPIIRSRGLPRVRDGA